MGNMTVEEIYRDRKQFSNRVFEVASTDFVNMGIMIISYTIKDITDDVGYLQVTYFDFIAGRPVDASFLISASTCCSPLREVLSSSSSRERPVSV